MVASPNYIYGIYDGASSSDNLIRNASRAIQYSFEQYFNNSGLKFVLTPFNGRSDYGPFISNGIPAGGLFTGAEGIKTIAQRDLFGGLANVA